MMSSDSSENNEHGTNRSRRLRSESLSDEEARQVDIGALSILRAQEIQAQRDEEAQQAADALRRSQVGVYEERPSILMLYVEYTKMLFVTIALVTLYLAVQELLNIGYKDTPQTLARYDSQLRWGVALFLVLFAWNALRIYFLRACDVLYVDVEYIKRTRRPMWYFGITKISFRVPTRTARCNPSPTNFEVAISNLGFDASTVDIDTPIQKDKPLHNLKYIKGADRLESIINS